jgi:hypothetical protein
MKLVKIEGKKETLYLSADDYMDNLKEKQKSIEYFIYGEGWRVTKNFKIIDVPDLHKGDKDLSWLEICLIVEKWGLLVGEYYSKYKVVGYRAARTIEGYYVFYERCKHLLNIQNQKDVEFFNLLKLDLSLYVFGIFTIDIWELDKKCGELDKDYNPILCTYKGKENFSLKDYIQFKFGEKYVEIIELLTKNN